MNLTVYLLVSFFAAFIYVHADVIITTVVDPDLDPRARVVELYVSGQEDLSDYSLSRNGRPGATLRLHGKYSNEFVYVVADKAAFTAVFGGRYQVVELDDQILSTGDDSIAIVDFDTGLIVDQCGVEGVDDHTDSFLQRVRGTRYGDPDGTYQWFVPGKNFLDGLSATQTARVVPFKEYRSQ